MRVVGVGAGVIGASVAYHLAKRGADVCVVDRAAGPGAGSTSRATGGFRSSRTVRRATASCTPRRSDG